MIVNRVCKVHLRYQSTYHIEKYFKLRSKLSQKVKHASAHVSADLCSAANHIITAWELR